MLKTHMSLTAYINSKGLVCECPFLFVRKPLAKQRCACLMAATISTMLLRVVSCDQVFLDAMQEKIEDGFLIH